ncbi:MULTISPECIES: Rossmann-like and DUF2520 domain-containing protein [unclassified Microbacterium]|uniref:Rossmann-like and DUF2520 domain-containing protein n=1 Tax=unclassified Microbacterium TaxID=2609290 RepID=UPI0016054DB7|nr:MULTISPECIES: Rossmann-like and DUF2520 domain-containing protein [unclassified Microbacterium]QNA91427.1 DUF2520 domain-containing protein [Microbacterium sp. Se63.02b]QYM64596.1 DUF2520 domain-containing protein [Microbacterium sp. Se5.02b]
MQTSSSLAPETTIALVGAGRLGRVLARALRAAGFAVLGPVRREQPMPTADIALLCVPDAAIPAVAFVARPHARLVGHVSGATPLTDVDFSLHPLQTFTGSETPDVFQGIGAAIAGRTDEAFDVADALARALGARPFAVDDEHRARYHAAASFASNFVLTVLDAAEQLASAAGIPEGEARDILAPLVGRTVENWTSLGAQQALTGPIARGDAQTVARQRSAAAELGLQDPFDALAATTRTIASRTPKTGHGRREDARMPGETPPFEPTSVPSPDTTTAESKESPA